jgi:hypothetical protein
MTMSSRSVSIFFRYWDDWKTKLDPLINRRNGKLFFPKLKKVPSDQDCYKAQPVDPIFIYSAPSKSSSHRGSDSSSRLIIFIDGSFEIQNNHEHPCLRSAECNLVFYNFKEEETALNLTLFEAIHFDFEAPDQQTPFHPLFHAQRGKSRLITDDRVKEIIAKARHISKENINLDGNGMTELGSPYFRLPTPQLDIFSVITLVMADYFCNEGIQSHNSFYSILEYLLSPRNIVSEGIASKALMRRIQTQTENQRISAAHWYKEYLDLPKP